MRPRFLALRFFALIAVAVLASQAGLSSNQREPQWVDANEGLPNYGVVTSLAFDAGNDDLIYASVYYRHGVYRSEDRGQTWQEADKGLQGTAVYALATSPTLPLTVYAGGADGLYVSPDGARSWHRLSTPEVPIYSLLIPRNAPDQIFAGSFGQLLVSKDGGQSFTTLTSSLRGITILSLATDEQEPSLIFAGTSGGGLLQTADGGATWTVLFGTKAVVAAVVVRPGDGMILVRAEDHLERGDEGGHNWQNLGPLPGGRRPLSLLVLPPSGETILAGSEGDGVYVTNDSGNTWRPLGEGLARGRVTALAASSSNPLRLAAGTPHGVFVSNDGGLHWQQGKGIGRPIVRGMILDKSKDRLLAGTTDGVYELSAGEWRPLGQMAEETLVLSMAIDAERPDTLYAGTWGASVQKSTDGGRTWQLSAGGNYSQTIIPGLLVDPNDSRHLYARVEYDRLIQSDNGGISWGPSDIGLTGVTVFAIAAVPKRPGLLYAGTDKGVYRSVDNGASWSRTSEEPWTGSTLALVVDPLDADHLQVGTTAGIYHSSDGGRSWKEARGLEDATVSSLVFDDSDTRHGYAGTRFHGVYQTEDAGNTWQPYGKGLDDATVNVLVLDKKANRLVAGTEEGVFTLDLPQG